MYFNIAFHLWTWATILLIDVAKADHAHICLAIHCLSLGTQHFNEDRARFQPLETGETYCHRIPKNTFGGLNTFSNEYENATLNPCRDCVKLDLDIYPIKVNGRVLTGWLHIKVQLQKLKTYDWDSVYIFSHGTDSQTWNSRTETVAVGEFTIDLLDECENNVNMANSYQLLPCHSTPSNQAVHPNTFYFTKISNFVKNKAQSEFHINWKMPPQYSCNPLRYIEIRAIIGIMTPVFTRRTWFGKGYLLKLKDDIFIGAPDPSPPFPKAGSTDCHNGNKNLVADRSVWLEQGFDSVQTIDERPPVLKYCKAERSSARARNKIVYMGRCKSEGNSQADADAAGSQNPLKCNNPNAHPFYKKAEVVTMDKYIADTRYDLCGCEDEDPEYQDPEPPESPTPSPNYRADPPETEDYDLESRHGSSSNKHSGEKFKSDNEYFEYYNKTVTQWRNFLKKARVTHGICGVLVFFLIVPMTIFYSRYLKEAFNDKKVRYYDFFYAVHVILILIGFVFLCMTKAAGVTCAVYAGEYGSFHAELGKALMILYVICIILGPIRFVSCIVTSIWLHVVFGLVIYLGGLTVIVKGAFGITANDALSKTLMENDIGQTSCIGLVICRIVIDIVFHVFMTKYARKHDGKLKLEKPRMIFPTVLKINERGSPPGTRFRFIAFIIYTIISFGLCVAFIFIMIYGTYDSKHYLAEKLIFEDLDKFDLALRAYGVH